MLQDKEAWEVADLLLSSDSERIQERGELLEQLQNMAGEHGEKVRDMLVSIQNRHLRQETENRNLNTRQHSAWNNLSAMRRIRERDRQYLRKLVHDLPASDPIDLEGADALYWYGVIARAGILSGYASEAERLLLAISRDGYATARDAWTTTNETLRTDGTYPAPVSIEEAVQNAVTHYGDHPLEPKFHEFWQYVWRVARTDAGLCGVFDEMAGVLGLPTEWTPTRDGYWLVSGTFCVRMYAEDVPVDEHPEFDIGDILETVGRHDVEIEDIEED